MAVLPAKVCLAGPKGVGKSSVIARLAHDSDQEVLPTSGHPLCCFNMSVRSSDVWMQIWDTSGEDRFLSMGPIYFKEANAALLVFDITSAQSLHDLEEWIHCVRVYAMDDYVMLVVGNKSDQEKRREVAHQEGKKYAESVGAEYLEISALTGEGVRDVFTHLCAMHIKNSFKTALSRVCCPVLTNQKKKKRKDFAKNNSWWFLFMWNCRRKGK